MKKTDISILAGLIISLFITFAADSNAHASHIRAQTLRLHIIADNNSEKANRTKLMVKNTISELCSSLYSGAESYSEALKITDSNIEYLEEAANSILRLNNAGYTARCSMEKFYFDTTEYSGFTLPRGEYTALTIRLGKAEGKNWWCVVYPTLCLSSAAEYDSSDDTAFISTDKFNIKFRTVEIWQDIKHLFTTSSPLYTHIE